jgi:hypothetical protein
MDLGLEKYNAFKTDRQEFIHTEALMDNDQIINDFIEGEVYIFFASMQLKVAEYRMVNE